MAVRREGPGYSKRFQKFQMNKWLGRFCEERSFCIVIVGNRASLTFLHSLLGSWRWLPVDCFSPAADLNLDTPRSPSFCNVGYYIDGVDVSATLVPALSDAEGYKDEGYFRTARRFIESQRLVLYCIDMSETRLRGSVLRTLQELKPDWRRTVVVLTFADALPALVRQQRHRDNPASLNREYFNTKLAEWTEELKSILERIGVQREVVAKINVCPIVNEPEDLLPNGEPWLPPLSLAIMEVLSPEKKAAFLKEYAIMEVLSPENSAVFLKEYAIRKVLSPEKKAAFLKEHATLLSTVNMGVKQPRTLSRTVSTVAEHMATMRVSKSAKVRSSNESSLQSSSVSSTLSEDQIRSIRVAFSKLRKDCPMFGILVIGRTGTGKSTLINNILGKKVARVGHTLQSETPEVSQHEYFVEGVPIIVYDTPGLGDVKGEKDEKKHLEIMKDFLAQEKIHLVMYCFQMNQTIMTSSIVGAICKYHQIGVDWTRSVIALTFADAVYVPKREQKSSASSIETSCFFNESLASLRSNLRRELKSSVGVKSDVVDQLGTYPTSLLPSDLLPNGKPWYVPLWLHIVEILSPPAAVRFLDIHRNNIYDEQASPPSTPAKAEVNLSGEYKYKFAVSIAAKVESPCKDNNTLAAAIVEAGLRAFTDLLNSPSEHSVSLTPPDSPGNLKEESILSQIVHGEYI